MIAIVIQKNNTIYGYIDHFNRALISVRLGNGEHITGQIDTGFNGLFLFSYVQALECGIRLPKKYDPAQGAGNVSVLVGRVEDTPYYTFGELNYGTILVSAPPKQDLSVRLPILRDSFILIGTRFLKGCQLSIRFNNDVRFPVRIIKIKPRPPKPLQF